MFVQGIVDPMDYIAWEDQRSLWRLVIEACKVVFRRYITLETLLFMNIANGTWHLYSRAAVSLVWPIRAYVGFF